MAATKVKLTRKVVDSLPVPAKGYALTWDAEQKDFGVRVQPTGLKVYFIQATKAGVQYKRKIGRADRMSPEVARAQARQLLAQIELGQAPERKAHLVAPAPAANAAPQTLAHLWERHQAEHLTTVAASSAAQYASIWKNHLEQHGPQRLAEITRTMVQGWHRTTTAAAGPVAANGMVRLLSALCNVAVERGELARNPARISKRGGIRLNKETGREVFMNQQQLAKVFAALHQSDTITDQLIEFLIYVGCRKTVAMQLLWSDVDLDRRFWRMAARWTKDRKVHHVPLSPLAVALLGRIERTGERVFAGVERNRLQRRWEEVRAGLGLENVRVHDCRHTFASLLAAQGESIQVIQKMLTHADIASTMRYAHLTDETLRQAGEKFSEQLGSIIGLRKVTQHSGA
jgi:integrase